MRKIHYVALDKIDADKFLPILNKLSTRKHLIAHEAFDTVSVTSWINDKLVEDNRPGCIVRAVMLDEVLVGWCGIQLSEFGFELAIVLDDAYWGLGKAVFKTLMSWASDFGHERVYIHLLHTRPQYKFLSKAAKRVFPTEMLGDSFTTYELNVENLFLKSLPKTSSINNK